MVPKKFPEIAKGSLNVSFPSVQLKIQDKHVVMDNGILQVTLSNPGGMVTGIQYHGIDNLLEVRNRETERGYYDMVWNNYRSKGTAGNLDRLEGTKMEVVVKNEEQVELSFTRMWDPSLKGNFVPLNIDKRFVMLRGSSGFYSYAIYEHLANWPAFSMDTTRIALKLRKDKFNYMAIADNIQRFMPLPEDRLPPRGQALAYPEAVRLVNPVEPEFKGEVDDKYEYSNDAKDIQVHGWISANPPVGCWQITPSYEFRSAGPSKQSLTSHNGPTSLSVFHSPHYAGKGLVIDFGPNEPWKKVYGPVFIYLNSLTTGKGPNLLWEDAKKQTINEVKAWPYDFPASVDFPSSNQRGSVTGRLLVLDRYINKNAVPGNGSYVGLALPGDVGSWQRECKGYQFWTIANKDGYFSINNVRAGEYNLYAWVPGVIGDYRNVAIITITSGRSTDVGNLVYEPPRDGPTLWEIGIPDRTAAEFYVPDPNLLYINKLYVNQPGCRYILEINLYAWVPGVIGDYRNVAIITITSGRSTDVGNLVYEPPRDGPTLWEIGIPDRTAAEFYVPDPNLLYINKLYVNQPGCRFRQYGLWERYAEIYPDKDLVYTVGVSDYTKDWFYAQVTRKIANKVYQGTTWQIKFNLHNVNRIATYKLRVALASASLSELQVRVNDPKTKKPLFSSGLIGDDNAIARHGIHGLYWLYTVDIPGGRLVEGDNTVFFTQPRSVSPFQGIMYDYIRLEGPPGT
nr:rhamnogalacturonate lyase [Quercus suber]